MTDTAKEVERPMRPEPCVMHIQGSIRRYPVDAVHFSSLTRYANQAERLLDAKDAELAALQVKLGEAERRAETMLAAINWACGCGPDEFHQPDEDTIQSRGRYWWRAGLTYRAGLVYDGSKYQSAALKACEGGQNG